MVIRRIAGFVALAISLTCGGDIGNDACEGRVGPILSPLDHPFQVAYGTALTVLGCAPATQWAGDCKVADEYLVVLLTAEPNGCPAAWISGSQAQTQEDMHLLMLAIDAPSTDGFVGSHDVSSSTAIYNLALDNGPFIVSGFLPQGTVPQNGFDALGASGAIVIATYAEGKEVVGSFDATFDDGSHVTANFDVPFCTSSCPGH